MSDVTGKLKIGDVVVLKSVNCLNNPEPLMTVISINCSATSSTTNYVLCKWFINGQYYSDTFPDSALDIVDLDMFDGVVSA